MSKSSWQTEAGVRRVWGVVGGMGPVASAEFLRTVYQCWVGEREQDAPVVHLVSDPTIPDRTECLLHGREPELLAKLCAVISRLSLLDVTDTVICCITVHHLLDRLPEGVARGVVSLLDTALNSVLKSEQRHLMICTEGTRQLRVFERHPSWARVEDRIVMPDEADQRAIHRLIYQVKTNRHQPEHLSYFDDLLLKYRLESLLVGCTDIHSLLRGRHFTCRTDDTWSYVDPLLIVAKEIARGQGVSTTVAHDAAGASLTSF
jgi:aspartate racemase